MTQTWHSALIFIVSIGCATTTNADTYRLTAKFQQQVPTTGDLFGTAVVLEGDVAAVKSHSGYVDGDDFIATHVFEEQSTGDWIETATLEHEGRNAFSYIGQELAIDDGELLVGYNNVGSIPLRFANRAEDWFAHPQLILGRNGFASLSPDHPAGRDVDMSDGFAIIPEIAARRQDGGLSVVRILQKSDEQWSEVANLYPEEGLIFNPFSVALDGSTAVYTTGHFNISGSSEIGGGVHFYERQEFQLADDDAVHSNLNLEIDGDTAVTRDIFSGDVTIFQRQSGSWQQTDRILTAPDLILKSTIDIEDNTIAYNVEDSEGNSHVEVIRKSADGTWLPYAIVENPEPELGMQFGASLALDDGRLLVGAMSTDLEANPDLPGAAYLFTSVPEPDAFSLIVLAGWVGLLLVRTRVKRTSPS